MSVRVREVVRAVKAAGDLTAMTADRAAMTAVDRVRIFVAGHLVRATAVRRVPMVRGRAVKVARSAAGRVRSAVMDRRDHAGTTVEAARRSVAVSAVISVSSAKRWPRRRDGR